MQKFQLFDKEVDIPMELCNFNVFRERYVKRAVNTRKEFAIKYKRFSSIKQMLNKYEDICAELLDTIASAAAGK